MTITTGRRRSSGSAGLVEDTMSSSSSDSEEISITLALAATMAKEGVV